MGDVAASAALRSGKAPSLFDQGPSDHFLQAVSAFAIDLCSNDLPKLLVLLFDAVFKRSAFAHSGQPQLDDAR
ncbi:MAG: Uncharacterised protein [Flavobacteriia bacterium]|nr:MAG: Uncharacterised protein [Flavobacteriia bacterium]